MFCGECGTQNPDTNQFCKECGKPLKKLQAGVPAPMAAAPAIIKPPLNNWPFVVAIMSVIAGGASWVLYPYPCGILAIILGGIALYKSENKKSKTAILGILGIVIGLASIILDIFYLTIFPPVNFIT
jgi:hypothetical protein